MTHPYAKVQPQAIPLEQAVLGALMLDREAVLQVVDLLSPESFYLDSHQLIYKAIVSLFNRPEPVDLLTVTEELRKSGDLEKVGNAYYLIELSNQVASSANIEYHSRIIQEKWMQRRLIETGTITKRGGLHATAKTILKMKVLNLYAGLGGNRQKWENCEVTAVEMEPEIARVYQDQFPGDTVVIGDAHEYLLENLDSFDFVWSSPPCQTHSKMMKATRHPKKRYTDMSLYQEIILLKHFFRGKWVVENVKPFYEPLIRPSAVLGRHCFWSNFFIQQKEIRQPEGFIVKDDPQSIENLKKWLGINYEGSIYYKDNHSPAQVLRNCVHPELGLHVFEAHKKSEYANLFQQ